MNLETRLAKLEAVQQAPTREYTDAERAVRLTHLIEKGDPRATKLLAKLANAKELGHEHDES